MSNNYCNSEIETVNEQFNSKLHYSLSNPVVTHNCIYFRTSTPLLTRCTLIRRLGRLSERRDIHTKIIALLVFYRRTQGKCLFYRIYFVFSSFYGVFSVFFSNQSDFVRKKNDTNAICSIGVTLILTCHVPNATRFTVFLVYFVTSSNKHDTAAH